MGVVWLGSFPARARILRAVRRTLDSDGYVEVSTPVRIPAPANEPHICPPESGGWFLRASPELQMKRLLALGFERIYQIGPCFRSGEYGSRHRPEFTMLEWYCAGAGSDGVISEMKRFVCAASEEINGSTDVTSASGCRIDLSGPWVHIKVRDAMLEFAGWDPLEEFDEDRFDTDMALKVEPALPQDRVCILEDYPAQAASLARLNADDPKTADRREVYIGGIELCNAFGELTDAAEQRRRFEEAAAKKRELGEVPMPMDEDFLFSLESMPQAGGAALGIDRLVMVLLGTREISDVLFSV